MNQPQFLNRDALKERIKFLGTYCEHVELVISHLKKVRDTKQMSKDEYNHWKWWLIRTIEETVLKGTINATTLRSYSDGRKLSMP